MLEFPIVQITSDQFLACIYGGVLVGIGNALVLRTNSSTGGTDLITHIIRTFNNRFKSSTMIMIIDIIIVVINVIFLKELEIALYSAIAIYVMGKMIDIVFEGIYFTKTIFIISEKYEQIANEIGSIVKRGSTGIYAKGMYSKEDKMMLFCIGSKSEVVKIKGIAKKIDPNSFIVITNAREVVGIGFKEE